MPDEITAEDAGRMRAYLLGRLRIDLQFGGFDRSDLLAVLSPMPSENAWLDHRQIQGTRDGDWFVWRDPASPGRRVHADQAIVEAGRIVGKFGCGLDFYTECAPLVMAPDVAQVMEATNGKQP